MGELGFLIVVKGSSEKWHWRGVEREGHVTINKIQRTTNLVPERAGEGPKGQFGLCPPYLSMIRWRYFPRFRAIFHANRKLTACWLFSASTGLSKRSWQTAAVKPWWWYSIRRAFLCTIVRYRKRQINLRVEVAYISYSVPSTWKQDTSESSPLFPIRGSTRFGKILLYWYKNFWYHLRTFVIAWSKTELAFFRTTLEGKAIYAKEWRYIFATSFCFLIVADLRLSLIRSSPYIAKHKDFRNLKHCISKQR